MLDWTGKPLKLAQAGTLGAVAAFLPGEFVQGALGQPESLGEVIFHTGMWIGVFGIGCATALVMGQNRYLHRPWLDGKEAGIAIGGGLLAGFVSGVAAQGFYSMALGIGGGNPVFGEISRVIAWSMFGALIGFGMSFVIPNLGRVRGFLGGGVAGAIGGVAFILAGLFGGDLLGRLVGMTAVGFVLGYVIGLVEEASRTAWLQISYGQSRETVRVSLGPELVCVGSNSQRCAIWAQGARSIAMRFRYVDGQVICDDMSTERTMVVESGFQQQVGSVNVLVCVGSVPAGAGGRSVGHPVPNPSVPPMPPLVSRAPLPPPPPGARAASPRSAQPHFPGGGRPAPPPPPPPPRPSR